MAVCPFFKMAAVLHVGFLKVGNLTAHTLDMANEHHRAKFHAGRSCRCRDMAVLRFFKMAAVRHLEFLKV